MLEEWLSDIRVFTVLQASTAANVLRKGHLFREKELQNLLKPLMFLAGTLILTTFKREGQVMKPL
jgi:hypothetical protein